MFTKFSIATTDGWTNAHPRDIQEVKFRFRLHSRKRKIQKKRFSSRQTSASSNPRLHFKWIKVLSQTQSEGKSKIDSFQFLTKKHRKFLLQYVSLDFEFEIWNSVLVFFVYLAFPPSSHSSSSFFSYFVLFCLIVHSLQ